MKTGIRAPSPRKGFTAGTRWNLRPRQSAGPKASRGHVWPSEPKKTAHNRIYNRTAVSFWGGGEAPAEVSRGKARRKGACSAWLAGHSHSVNCAHGFRTDTGMP